MPSVLRIWTENEKEGLVRTSLMMTSRYSVLSAVVVSSVGASTACSASSS